MTATGEPAGEDLEGAAEAVLAQDRGMQAAGDLAQLLQARAELLQRLVEQAAGDLRLGLQL